MAKLMADSAAKHAAWGKIEIVFNPAKGDD
jgi:hypothetical protein